MAIDHDKLTEFLNKFVGDLGATMAAGNVLVGDRLGFLPCARRAPDAAQREAKRLLGQPSIRLGPIR